MQRVSSRTTPHTARLWREFVSSLESPALKKWDIREFQLPVIWTMEPPAAGTPVRVVHDVARHETTVYSIELERIGYIAPPFSREPAGILLPNVSSLFNPVSRPDLCPPDFIIT